MDGFHVQGMTEDKGDVFSLAEICEPIPSEDALDGDHDIVAVGGKSVEERPGSGRHIAVGHDITLGIEDAEVHGASVQVDATIILMCSGVESH